MRRILLIAALVFGCSEPLAPRLLEQAAVTARQPKLGQSSPRYPVSPAGFTIACTGLTCQFESPLTSGFSNWALLDDNGYPLYQQQTPDFSWTFAPSSTNPMLHVVADDQQSWSSWYTVHCSPTACH